MSILVLAAILIGLAVLERILYIKKNESWHKIKFLMGILIACFLLLISYLVTDTTIGVLYVFLSISVFILIGIVDFRSDIEYLKYLSYIIGLPLMAYLLIKSIQNMLIKPQYIFLLLIIMVSILGYSYKRKNTKKEIIALIIGVMITVILILSYSKFSGIEEKMMLKQGLVAQKYLEEELDIYGAYIPNLSGINLRGEDIRVTSYDLSGNVIKMIYKNGKIISHDVRNN